MDLKPIADFFAHFSWSELVSAVLAAGIVAVVNIVSNHKLAKKRDKENRDATDELQRKAENRQYRTAEDDRRDADKQREQKERLQAVKSFYVAFANAVDGNSYSQPKIKELKTVTKVFRLEATALDRHMQEQTNKILEIIERLDHLLKAESTSEGHRASRIIRQVRPLQEPLFNELLIWGLHGKSRKVSELLDHKLNELVNNEIPTNTRTKQNNSFCHLIPNASSDVPSAFATLLVPSN